MPLYFHIPMSEIAVSIIVPTYNSEKFIRRLLDGLFAYKGYVPFEVIIADGMSKDKTIKICREYPVSIYNNPKVDAAAARNIGIKHAQGDICAFIDSDCIPCENWVQKVYEAFDTPDIVAIGGKMLQHTPTNRVEAFSGRVFLQEHMKFPDQIIHVSGNKVAGAFLTANSAYKKSLLEHIGGLDERYSNYGEDIDLFWRAVNSRYGDMVFHPEITVEHSFPTTIRKMRKKFEQYGIADSRLNAAYSKKKVNFNPFYYKQFLYKLVTLPFHPVDNFLYLLYIPAHIQGKIKGARQCGIINF